MEQSVFRENGPDNFPLWPVQGSLIRTVDSNLSDVQYIIRHRVDREIVYFKYVWCILNIYVYIFWCICNGVDFAGVCFVLSLTLFHLNLKRKCLILRNNWSYNFLLRHLNPFSRTCILIKPFDWCLWKWHHRLKPANELGLKTDLYNGDRLIFQINRYFDSSARVDQWKTFPEVEIILRIQSSTSDNRVNLRVLYYRK